MKRNWQKNPLSLKRRKKIHLIRLRLDRAGFMRKIEKELMKPAEKRDRDFINELYETVDYLDELIASHEQRKRAVVHQKKRMGIAYAGVALAFMLLLSFGLQLSGVRIWTAILQGDFGYLQQDYSKHETNVKTAQKSFDTLEAAYAYIGKTLSVPQAVNAAPVSNITVIQSSEFSNDNTKVTQLRLSYEAEEDYVGIEVFLPDNGNVSVFGDDYPDFTYSLGNNSGSAGALISGNAEEALGIDFSDEADSIGNNLITDKSSQRIGNDAMKYIKQEGDVLSIQFIYDSSLYSIITNRDVLTIQSIVAQICGQGSLDLLD